MAAAIRHVGVPVCEDVGSTTVIRLRAGGGDGVLTMSNWGLVVAGSAAAAGVVSPEHGGGTTAAMAGDERGASLVSVRTKRFSRDFGRNGAAIAIGASPVGADGGGSEVVQGCAAGLSAIAAGGGLLELLGISVPP